MTYGEIHGIRKRALQVCAACDYPAPALARLISNAVAIDDGNLVGLPDSSPVKTSRGGGFFSSFGGSKRLAASAAAVMTRFDRRRKKKKWVQRQADKENRSGAGGADGGESVSSFINAGDMWARPVDLAKLEEQLDEYLMVMS